MVLGLIVGSWACAAPQPAITTPGEVSFAGKSITIVNPDTAGSSSDILIGVYAQHLNEWLPGRPSIVVRDMPGGGGTVSANYVYASPPNGLTLLNGTAAIFLNPLLGMPAVKYSITKMTSIIRTVSSTIYYCSPDVADKPEDIMKAKNMIFGGGPGISTVLFLCTNEFIGFPIDKAVLAYTGGGDRRRAFLSGEINTNYEGSAPGYYQYLTRYNMSKGCSSRR